MAPLGALTQARTSAEASLPLGWQLSSPNSTTYCLRRLADRLRERRDVASG